jgi:lysozyme family protein
MTDNFERCLAHVLKSEGGWVNHPNDPGGETNLGVTRRVWEDWTGKQGENMKSLTPEMVAPLYKANYWAKCNADALPVGVDLCVFDFAVNSGTRRAVVFLQRIAKVSQDGVLGPKSMAAVNAISPETLVKEYCMARRLFIRGLKTYEHFGRGWERRINSVESDALIWLTQ